MTTPERGPALVAARGPRKLAPLVVACVLSLVAARCVMVPWAEVVVPWPERAVGVRIMRANLGQADTGRMLNSP